jgi:hypothetical protein
MWVSTRHKFGPSDASWTRYIGFIGLPHLSEVRSIDSALNDYVDGCGSIPLDSLSDLPDALAALPNPKGEREYSLLFLDAEIESAPLDVPRFRLLGHDLSDETHTSSLLNCGPWTGKLAPFAHRLNEFALLTLGDARLAKSLLPEAWPDDPHANVTVWALYEIDRDR